MIRKATHNTAPLKVVAMDIDEAYPHVHSIVLKRIDIGPIISVYDRSEDDLVKAVYVKCSCYGLTHKEKATHLLDEGLIHKQPFQQKLVMAIVIAGIFTAVAIAVGGSHALVDIITGATAVVGLMLGFYASVFLFKGKRMDLDPVRKAMNALNEAEKKIHSPEATKIVAEPTIEEPKEKQAPPPDAAPDWREGIKKFTQK